MFRKPKFELKETTPKKQAGSQPNQVTLRTSRIAAGCRMEGELSGESDVKIAGTFIGNLKFDGFQVVVEPGGKVEADISAREIRVSGHVHGDLRGRESVILTSSAYVVGNIFSKSVAMETGARFKGAVDMEMTEPRPLAFRDRRSGPEAVPSAAAPDLRPAATGT